MIQIENIFNSPSQVDILWGLVQPTNLQLNYILDIHMMHMVMSQHKSR